MISISVCGEINVREKRGVIRNGQHRDTGRFGYTRNRTKTNKTKNISQKIRNMSNTDPTKNRGLNTGSRKG